MTTHGGVVSSHRRFVKKRRQAACPHFDPHTRFVASQKKKPGAMSGSALSTLLGKLSVSLVSVGIYATLFGLGAWLVSGFALGKVDPEYMVTVQQFEISPEIAKQISLTGKSASDIVVDTLNDVQTHASQFHGAEYYYYKGTAFQSVALNQSIKVPVQTTYGIELKGISLDSILQLYDRNRYKQWIIGGNVLSSGAGLVGRIRLNRDDAARFWETPAASPHTSPSDLIRDATYLMLESVFPEVLGRAYLQQGKYAEASEVFRQWAQQEPRNWKPTYYLSLAYAYQGNTDELRPVAEQQASDLARWSESIADHEKIELPREVRQALDLEITDAPTGDQSSKALVRTGSTPEHILSAPVGGEKDSWWSAAARLHSFFGGEHATIDDSIRRARSLSDEASKDAEQGSSQAVENLNEALASLDQALATVPENAGLHEQRGILLKSLADLMKQRNMDAQLIRMREEEAADEYTRALQLRPDQPSPLWGAVYTMIDLGDTSSAIRLARTMTLLQPYASSPNTAYLVALVQAAPSTGQGQERNKLVEDRLKLLFKLKVEEGQLQTLWFAFKATHQLEALAMIATEGQRRFPANCNFKDRMPFLEMQGSVYLRRTATLSTQLPCTLH